MIKRRKFGNTKVKAFGITFDSKKEYHRFVQLKVLQQAGKISSLEVQPAYEILEGFKYNGETLRKRRYTADFRYKDDKGRLVVEDVKSAITKKEPAYRLRRQLFLQRYGADIVFIET